MKLNILILFLFSAFLVSGQKLPTKQQVLGKMILTNDYFMNKWTDPGKEIITNRARPSNIWTRSTYYEGLMALYAIKPDKKYLTYAIDWSTAHKWEPAYTRLARNADNQCCGQTYLDLYKMDPQPIRIAAIKEAVDSMVASNKIDDWWWIDALQMAMPVFARLGNITGEAKYWDRMHAMYTYTKTKWGKNGLYNPIDRLWWRDADFVAPYKEPNGEDCYWSRGNGWVLAAMVRVLEQNPPNKKHKAEYIKMLKDMSEALLKVQREDGFWNVSLHDPSDFGGPETSGTAFFVYGMAWGINHGYLKKKTYLPPVLKAWNAMCDKAVHPDGMLGYVQGTGKEPKASQPVLYDKEPDFNDYGLGAFLLAGSEVYKLVK